MKTEIVDYYAKRAVEHDRIYDLPERQADIQKLHEVCKTKFKDLDVLEVSCGTGYWTQSIASSAKSVMSLDINDEVLAIARSRKWKTTSVEFKQADSYSLPRFDCRFNSGFAGFWWSHIPKMKLSGFLSGFHDRLDSGSLIVFIDNRYVDGSSTPISRVDENGDSYQLRRISDGSTYEVLKNFPSEEELKNLISEIAYSVEVTILDYYWILSYRKK